MFVRGEKHNPEDDMGIEKVIFRLHKDYKPATVTVEAPPFEVARQGRSKFDVGMSIYMKGRGMADQIVNLVRTLHAEYACGGFERLALAIAPTLHIA